ncbi:hypothetical protein MMB68_10385 [Priestia sp. Y58]|uniref:hypothetical protein n=1 Tax=Priestia sp. Y58 TaxID=2922804 RepID=UPI00240533D7|nr:hypothetical protein [Priestia sp. Y58]MDG0029963.1 hypothetical protein [Priestia sp. Y58]
MDSQITEVVAKKLEEFGLPDLNNIPQKSINRLVSVETYLQRARSEQNSLIKELKEKKITKVSIVSAQEVNISRKTLYNDQILKEYIDKSIQNESEIFNEDEISKLKLQVKELTEEYEKLLNNVIDHHLLRMENRGLQQELNDKYEEIKTWKEIDMEKENKIRVLTSQVRKSNLLEFKSE